MLKEQMQKEIVVALKAGNKLEVSVLRFLVSEIKYAEINKQKDLTDEEVISVLQKELKKRKDAIEMFAKNGRKDVVESEEKQLAIVARYLPKELTQVELEKIVDEAIAKIGPNPVMGKVMGIVIGQVKGRADGKVISELVKQKLA
jgi:uncharacterized protein